MDGDQSALKGKTLTFEGLGDLIITDAAYDGASKKTTLTLDISNIQRQTEEQRYFTEYSENTSRMTTVLDRSELTSQGTTTDPETGDTVINEIRDDYYTRTHVYEKACLIIPAVESITSAAVQNVDFNIQPGDAPKATAEVPDHDAGKYEIAYECWQEFDNNKPVAAWYSDNGSHGSLPAITRFEAGKTYRYGVFVSANGDVGNVRYVFGPDTKLKINGNFVNYKQYEGYKPDFSDGTTMSMWVLTDLAMTPETSGEVTAEKYTVTYTDGVDGEEVFKDQTHTVQAGKATPAFNGTPARKGYKFVGWSPAVAGTVTGNAVYKAIWKPNSATNTSGTASPKPGATDNAGNSATPANGTSDTAAMPKTGAAGDAVLRITLLFAGVGALAGAATMLKRRKYNR